MTTEKQHNFNVENEDIKIVKELLYRSIQVETAAKESEAWDSEGQQ